MEKFVLEKIMTNITDIFHSVALTYMLTAAVYLSDQLILIFNKKRELSSGPLVRDQWPKIGHPKTIWQTFVQGLLAW